MDQRSFIARRAALARLFASTALLGATSLLTACGGGGSGGGGTTGGEDSDPAAGPAPSPAPAPSGPPTSASSSPSAYVTSFSNDFTKNGVSGLRLDASGAPPALANNLPIAAPTGIVLTPDNRFLYVGNGDDGTIGVFNVDQATGHLTQAQTPWVLNGNAPGAMAIRPTGDFLFVASQGQEELSVYSLDVTSGLPTKVQAIATPLGATPVGLAMHPTGQFLYVSSDVGKRIDTYAIGGDGMLTPTSSIAGFEEFPGMPFVEPSGRFLLFSYIDGNEIMAFPIDPATGALLKEGFAQTQTPSMQGCARLAFNPRLPGQVYVSTGKKQVAQFTLDPGTGALQIVRWQPVVASTITSLAVDAAGAVLYACDGDAGVLHSFSCDPSTGKLAYLGNLPIESPREIVLANV